MKKIYFVLLLSVLPWSLNAAELSCSKNGTAILYVNGIMNSPRNAFDSAEKVTNISESVKLQLDKNTTNISTLYHDYHYNRTEGIGLDIIETAAQIIRSYLPNVLNPYKEWSRYLRLGTFSSELTNTEVLKLLASDLADVEREVSQFSPVAQDTIILAQKIGGYLDNNRKVILVSHSQGNLFSNEAYTESKEFVII